MFSSGEVPSPAGPAGSDDITRLRSFPALVAEIELLHANALLLHALAAKTGLQVTSADTIWKELIDNKVLRQFRARKALSIVVAGGTKAGKSSVFNHMVGKKLSQTSHVAAATKQTVVAVPPALYDVAMLQLLFPEMELVERASPQDATEDTGTRQKLLLQKVKELPDDLIMLDIPDIDSVQRDNWKKAYDVTRSSDVVVAMITEEKHGDEMINTFFSSVAAQANKPIVLVINKVDEVGMDRQYWKDWMEKFCEGTNIVPIAAYVVPRDGVAAEQGKQKFFRIKGDLSRARTKSGTYTLATESSSLHRDMKLLNVDTLKAQAQIGALLQALEGQPGDGVGGLSRYLDLIRKRSASYQESLDKLNGGLRRHSWPTPPLNIMHRALENWWANEHRWEITKSLSALAYSLSLTRYLPNAAKEREKNEILEYQALQNSAMDKVVSELFQELSPMVADSAHMLSPEARSLLSPLAQGQLLEALKTAYKNQRDPAREFEKTAAQRLPQWSKENPLLMTILQGGDILQNAILRPVMVVGGTVAGIFAPVLMGPGALAQNTTTNVATSGLGNMMGSGTSAVLKAMGTDISVEYFFTELAVLHAATELDWINDYIVNKHLKPILEELNHGAALTNSAEFKTVESCVVALKKWAQQFPKTPTAALN